MPSSSRSYLYSYIFYWGVNQYRKRKVTQSKAGLILSSIWAVASLYSLPHSKNLIHTGPSWSDERFCAHSSQILNLSTCDSDLIFALLRAQTRRGGTGGSWRAWCPSCYSACSAWRSRPRAPRCSSPPAGPSPTLRVRQARRSTPGAHAPDVHADAEFRFALACVAKLHLHALISCIGKRSLAH